MKIKAIIFDLDGTLYDNGPLLRRMLAAELPNLRLLIAERRCRRLTEDTTREAFFRDVASRSGKDAGQVARWFDGDYLPRMVRIMAQKCRAYPWVEPLLGTLSGKGIKTAVFSDYGLIDEKLEALGLHAQKFDLRIDAFEAGGLKPSRKAFLKVAGLLGEKPEDILVIGDRDDTDGKGAANAGMNFLKINGTKPDLTPWL